MKHAGWVAGAAILAVFVTALEVERNLHGPWWAVGIASGAVALVALAALYLIARWADKKIDERKRDE